MIKSILVLPGGKYQISLIKKLKSMGYKVICADRDENCPGAFIADEFYGIGLNEFDNLLELAKKKSVKGILTDETDAAVRVVASLSDKMGLRGIGIEISDLYTKKNLMREFGKKNGFPTPDFKLCFNEIDAFQFGGEIGYPLIVKPNSGQASKGVHKISKQSELPEYFLDALNHSDNHGVIVEEFISGIEFTVEGFMGGGEHHSLAISRKTHYSEQPMVASSLLYSAQSNDSTIDYIKLKNLNNQWVNSSKLAFGMTHAEYKFSNGNFYLIEIAARGGGTKISSHIVPWVSGIDYQKLLIDVVIDGKFQKINTILERVALLEFLKLPNGFIVSLDGASLINSLGGIADMEISYKEGDFVSEIKDDTSRAGHFILTADSYSELITLRENVLNNFKVKVI